MTTIAATTTRAEHAFAALKVEGGILPPAFLQRVASLAVPGFGEDGRRRAPHAAMQELLNADPGSLWGLVSNGIKVRLVRDNPSLTRPAYVEADLERVFEERLYADFAAFWLMFHASRL